MKKLILIFMVFITTVIFSQDLCVYFPKETKWLKNKNIWCAPDSKINFKMKELG